MSSFGGAELGAGQSYPLEYSTTTFATHHRNLALEYTSQNKTCQTFDASAWAIATATKFAGIAAIEYPWKSPPLDYPYPYDAQSLSAGYPTFSTTTLELTPTQITVLHRVRTHAIPAEALTVGQLIMLTDVADHTAGTDCHDGMISPADTGTANEMYSVIGVCEVGATPATTHTLHSTYWDIEKGDFTYPYGGGVAADLRHPKCWVNLYR